MAHAHTQPTPAATPPLRAATRTAGGTNGGTTQNPYSFHVGLQDRATGYIMRSEGEVR